MKRQFLAVLVATTLVVAASSALAVEQTMVFSGDGAGTGDVYEELIATKKIDGGYLFAGGDRNYGTLSWFAANEPALARSLIRFDVSALAGQYVSVSSVTMRLRQITTGYVPGGAAGVGINVDAFRITPVNSNWAEGLDAGSYTAPPWWGVKTTWNVRLIGIGGWTGNGFAGGLGMPGGAGYDVPAFGTGTSNGVDTWMDVPIGGDLMDLMDQWTQNPVVNRQVGEFGTEIPDNPVLNEGILLQSDGLIQWSSAEGAFSPELVVVYDDGEGEWPVGDFDHDMDVDDADIDMLSDFIRLGLPYDAEYDISADGTSGGSDSVVDILDLDYHIRSLVETATGNGTEYGDFNLDGMIDVTDLTRLAANYGPDDWMWDDGNANRHIDTDIDNTDLTILATYYGFVAPDVVPEPMTLSLLAVGGAVLFRRRK